MSVPGGQVVADAGIFLASVLEETHSKRADTLIELWNTQSVNIAAPTLFRYETTVAIRKHVYRGNLTSALASKARAKLNMLMTGITFMVDDALLERGYEIAE